MGEGTRDLRHLDQWQRRFLLASTWFIATLVGWTLAHEPTTAYVESTMAVLGSDMGLVTVGALSGIVYGLCQSIALLLAGRGIIGWLVWSALGFSFATTVGYTLPYFLDYSLRSTADVDGRSPHRQQRRRR